MIKLITETYKKRLQELAGIKIGNNNIIVEATDIDRNDAFAASDTRIPFNKDLMVKAIQEGREIGLLFQSDNEKYKMPVAKYRIVYPVAMGMSKAGNLVIRAFHKFGQSEREAIKTGRRSAEAENVWRLFKSINIKGMWFTGNFFRVPLEGYNAQDKGMTIVQIAANFNSIKQIQDKIFKQLEAEENKKPEDQQKQLKTFPNIEKAPIIQPVTKAATQPAIQRTIK